MKKIAAYVGLASSIDRVYSKDTLQTLSDRYDFIADGKTLTKDELLSHPEANSVQYLFSTWGMPHFTNEETEAPGVSDSAKVMGQMSTGLE